MSLSEEQVAVVESKGHTMVVAIPGSGKTHVIIERCRKLIECEPSLRIAMVTFTRAAANEMVERLGKDPRCKTVKANTFHSFAIAQQRKAGGNKTMVMGGAQAGYIFRAMNKEGYGPNSYDEVSEAFEHFNRMLTPAPGPLQVDEKRERKKENEKDKKKNANISEHDQYWDVYTAYRDILEENNSIDLADIARECVFGMRNGTTQPLPVDHLFIDEFQDTDEIQYAWISEHIKAGICLTIVGDDDQSIYGWRGGMGYQGFVDFQNETRSKAHSLTVSYRCRPEILEVADRLIRKNKERVDKNIRAKKEPGGKVQFLQYADRDHEAEAIGKAIAADPEGGWAILARTNSVLDKIQAQLDGRDIVNKRLGGKSLWEGQGATLFLGVLSSLCSTRQVGAHNILAWMRVSDPEISRFLKEARLNGGGEYIRDKDIRSYHNAIKGLIGLKRAMKPKIKRNEVAEVCRGVYKWMESSSPPSKALKVAGIVADIFPRMYEGLPIEKKIEKLRKIVKQEREEKGVKVVLATMHSSKGLEFKKVWLPALNNGVIPAEKSVSDEEERRLLFVGITRAEEELTVSWSKIEASPFLGEIYEIEEDEDDELEKKRA